MDLLLAFRVMILAIIQGVAEFLPISSSGHLLVLGRLFQLPDVFLLTILLHLGTLMSVIVFFYRDICDVFAYNRRVIWLVIVGSIPTVAIAFSVMKYFPHLESSRAVAGVCFLVTGFLLLTLMRNHSRTETEEYYEKIAYEEEGYEPPVTKTSENTSTWDAFIIGIAQGIAVLPGLSRSGSTISAGVMRRFNNEWSAKFSFLLSIPVIAGGAALEIYKEYKEVGADNIASMFKMNPTLLVYIAGMLISFLVGWISLFYLMQMLKAGKLHRFAYWLFIIGIVTLLWTASDHREEIPGLIENGRLWIQHAVEQVSAYFNKG